MYPSKPFNTCIFVITSVRKPSFWKKTRRGGFQPTFPKRALSLILSIWLLLAFMSPGYAQSQKTSRHIPTAYFIDGYHGGIWGHFPYKYASFIEEQMRRHPGWKVNLEIEPVTWDSIKAIDPKGYRFIQKELADTTALARMEYVNPAFGQPYMFNISGESIIRQFYYGMKSLRRHFNGIQFSTYSSEEPCFTSQLPGILRSFGFKYASLKNPNTCWGGYTRPHEGGLIYWTGPNGSSILTVPRYISERLQKGSTWQTIAWRNSPGYIKGALQNGIQNPVGMCLQDAGWRVGPWLGTTDAGLRLDAANATVYPNSVYSTWQGYFEKAIAIAKAGATSKNAYSGPLPVPEWKLSQEDIQVSLVWGGQILQKVARAVRRTENRLITAETLATLNHLFTGNDFPSGSLDKAWENLLLSQHHDCWIVPYNKKHGRTWQQQVDLWTDTALHIADSLIYQDPARKYPLTIYPDNAQKLTPTNNPRKQARWLKIYNSTGSAQTAMVSYELPGDLNAEEAGSNFQLLDPAGKNVRFQVAYNDLNRPDETGNDDSTKDTIEGHGKPVTIHFEATVPAMGFAIYRLTSVGAEAGGQKIRRKSNRDINTNAGNGPIIRQLKNGLFQLQTARYALMVDPKKGGAITSLQLKSRGTDGKKVATHEFLPQKNKGESSGLNTLRGYFYNQHRFRSSDEQPAKVTVIANGDLYAALKIRGRIAGAPFTQILELTQNGPLIKTKLIIDWDNYAGDPGDLGIGAYNQTPFKNEDPNKAFYNSRYKLLTLFPVQFKEAVVEKDAPFDIYKSKLDNTFFDRWDSIKNDVLLHWVNLEAADGSYGFALFSTATTSYAHGPGVPLGLTTQYIGRGLFGADYKVQGPTVLDYAFMPNAGKQKTISGVSQAAPSVPQAAEAYNKPLMVTDMGFQPFMANAELPLTKSLLTLPANSGWQVSAFKMGSDLTREATRDSPADKLPDFEKAPDSYLLRLFNATGDDRLHELRLSLRAGTKIRKIECVDLSGAVLRQLPYDKSRQAFTLGIPPLGIKNIRITFW